MIIIYYISLVINILCILTIMILNYLEYKKITKINLNKILIITIIISGLIFSIIRNLL